MAAIPLFDICDLSGYWICRIHSFRVCKNRFADKFNCSEFHCMFCHILAFYSVSQLADFAHERTTAYLSIASYGIHLCPARNIPQGDDELCFMVYGALSDFFIYPSLSESLVLEQQNLRRIAVSVTCSRNCKHSRLCMGRNKDKQIHAVLFCQ